MNDSNSGRIVKIVMYREVRRDQTPYAWLWKFRALPTWILTMILWPTLKADHPWRQHEPFSLMEWYAGQTEECRTCDLGLWLCGAMFVALTVQMVTR